MSFPLYRASSNLYPTEIINLLCWCRTRSVRKAKTFSIPRYSFCTQSYPGYFGNCWLFSLLCSQEVTPKLLCLSTFRQRITIQMKQLHLWREFRLVFILVTRFEAKLVVNICSVLFIYLFVCLAHCANGSSVAGGLKYLLSEKLSSFNKKPMLDSGVSPRPTPLKARERNRPHPSSKNPHFQNEAKCRPSAKPFLWKWVLFAWE